MSGIDNFINKIKSSPLAIDSFWTLLGSGIGKGLSLIAGIFVARLLGSETYGEYGTIRTTLIYIAIVSTFGFGYTATKFIAEYLKRDSKRLNSLVRKFLIITISFSIILSLLFTIFAEDIAQFLKDSNLATLLKRYSILIVFNAIVGTQIAIISGFKNFRSVSIVNIWSGIIVFVGSIVLTYLWGIDGSLLTLLVSFIVQALMNQIIISKKLRTLKYNSILPWQEVLPIIRFSIPVALQESLYTIVHWSTLWLLIYYSDYTQVGISSAGSLWQSMVLFIPAMLKNVMFSYLTTNKYEKRLTNKLIYVNLISSLLPALIVIFLSGLLLDFYGPSFNGVQYVITICVLSSVVISVSEVYCYKLISEDKPWFVFLSRFLRDIVIFLSAYILLKKYQSNEALYIAIISFIANLLYLVFISFMNRIINRRC